MIPIHSGEDWVAQLADDLSQPTAIANTGRPYLYYTIYMDFVGYVSLLE